MLILRNLLFYPAFYIGSMLIIGTAALMRPFGPNVVRAVIQQWSHWHRICVVYLLGIKVVVEGEMPPGPALFAVKHESYFEAVDAPMMHHHPVPFAKKELYRIPGWRISAAAYGSVPVSRDQGARALREMVRAGKHYADEGRPLVIFPEGTRVRHGECPPLQAGFAGLYKMLNIPVVPVAVNSGPLYHQAWKRKGTITYRIGETIPPGLPRAEVETRVLKAINALNN